MKEILLVVREQVTVSAVDDNPNNLTTESIWLLYFNIIPSRKE